MEVFLKRAIDDDIPQLIELEKSVAGTKIYDPMLTGEEWLVALEIGFVYLIQVHGVSVGSISYEKKGDSWMHISGLVVDPGFQGKGIGREALTQLLVELKGVKRIDLVTHPDNAKALKLYKSFGFVEESRKENFFGDGEPRIILALEK